MCPTKKITIVDKDKEEITIIKEVLEEEAEVDKTIEDTICKRTTKMITIMNTLRKINK